MKKILLIFYLLVVGISVHSWTLCKTYNVVGADGKPIIWDSSIIWDKKDHMLRWKFCNPIVAESPYTIHIKVMAREIDEKTGKSTYFIDGYSFWNNEVSTFVDKILKNKDLYNVTSINTSYPILFGDAHVFFRGEGDFAANLLTDWRYQGFEY